MEKPPKQSVVCKKCGIYIEFIKTARGKFMPVDPKLITVVDQQGNTHKGYIPHWATCPNADDFRKLIRLSGEK